MQQGRVRNLVCCCIYDRLGDHRKLHMIEKEKIKEQCIHSSKLILVIYCVIFL